MAEPHALPVAVGPRVTADEIVFALPDPGHRLAGVRLAHELNLPGLPVEFGFDEAAGAWTLTIPRPPVRRMEYRLELRHPDGGTENGTDPTNPVRTPGAFGDKSVLTMPGYTAPAWLAGAPPWPAGAPLAIRTGVGPVEVTVLSPDRPARHLLLAHDGPEFDRLGALGRFAATMVRDGRLPPFHLVLAAPGSRDARYSANPAYATALATVVLPRLHAALGSTGPAVLIGASLGALAALHAQRRYPNTVGGLFLQSGSFFVPEHDECERNYRYYPRVTRYVATVRHAGPGPAVPVTLTCGAVEENANNNRLMADILRRQGYPATLHEVPDAHNYVAWRDALDPHLTGLLARVWAADA
ncbi:MAG TPA: alpha/beta hydrolase-fold protein [Actinophytocola sp.]|uniref:alpha/beta hydrolase n=1 Tax=Actinophytocola sp. TaxID=1872138 RepID=UPI002DB80A93|nr:alpha/beta hydrolase-fold protein [Actinophytocola sp.]HEU5471443.1 alpha/beta hydrolase-fold protein [Actinophytocola sp.]